MTKKELLREEYKSRINRVLDYIDKHISEELNVALLASVANFSTFHFHRIFSAMVGEPLWKFIRRIRIEKAAGFLANNPKMTISDIAYDSGFSGPSAFARAFGEVMGISPGEWRERCLAAGSRMDQSDSKNGQSISNNEKNIDGESSYFATVIVSDYQNNHWRISMNNVSIEAKVTVKEVPDMHVAYVRHIGPYQGDQQLFDSLFTKLCRWAGPRGLLNFPETKFITIYHDNPEVTEDDKLRISVCITVPADIQVSGEIGSMTLPGGKYAIAEFEIDPSQYGDIWNAVYGGWMPESGYQPDDRPCFELYLNDPKQHPQGKHIVAIYAPVKPL